MALVCLISAASAQTQPLLPDTFESSESSRVSVLVESTDESVKSSLLSYISKELRSLGDVHLVETRAHYVINVIAIKCSDSVVTSVLVERKAISDGDLPVLLGDAFPKDKIKKLEQYFDPFVVREDYRLFSDHKSRIRELCQDIVARIDVSVFDADRKMFARYRDTMKELKRPIEPLKR